METLRQFDTDGITSIPVTEELRNGSELSRPITGNDIVEEGKTECLDIESTTDGDDDEKIKRTR